MTNERQRGASQHIRERLLRGIIGHAVQLLEADDDPHAALRALQSTARLLVMGRPSSPDERRHTVTAADLAASVAWLAAQMGGRVQYDLADDSICFRCAICLFEQENRREPDLCRLWWESVRRVAADCFGYGKVGFKTRIVTGRPLCETRLYLQRTAEAETVEEMAVPAAGRVTESNGHGELPADETIRRLQAKVRTLEQRTRELERMLDERKIIERAKGILMQRLRLSEPEAMRRLQQESQARNKKLIDLARILVEAGEMM